MKFILGIKLGKKKHTTAAKAATQTTPELANAARQNLPRPIHQVGMKTLDGL